MLRQRAPATSTLCTVIVVGVMAGSATCTWCTCGWFGATVGFTLTCAFLAATCDVMGCVVAFAVLRPLGVGGPARLGADSHDPVLRPCRHARGLYLKRCGSCRPCSRLHACMPLSDPEQWPRRAHATVVLRRCRRLLEAARARHVLPKCQRHKRCSAALPRMSSLAATAAAGGVTVAAVLVVAAMLAGGMEERAAAARRQRRRRRWRTLLLLLLLLHWSFAVPCLRPRQRCAGMPAARATVASARICCVEQCHRCNPWCKWCSRSACARQPRLRLANGRLSPARGCTGPQLPANQHLQMGASCRSPRSTVVLACLSLFSLLLLPTTVRPLSLKLSLGMASASTGEKCTESRRSERLSSVSPAQAPAVRRLAYR